MPATLKASARVVYREGLYFPRNLMTLPPSPPGYIYPSMESQKAFDFRRRMGSCRAKAQYSRRERRRPKP